MPTATAATLAAIDSLRREVHEALRQLVLGRAISFAHLGGASLRLPERDRFALVTLEQATDLGTRPVAYFDSAGAIAESETGSSLRDEIAIHAAIFAARPAARAILRLRARHLTGWAVAQRPIPSRYFQMFNYTKAPEIPVAGIAGPDGTDALAVSLRQHPDAPAILLSDGTVVVWGKGIVAAARLVLGLEEAAHVSFLAERLGGAKPYPAGIPEAIYGALAAHAE